MMRAQQAEKSGRVGWVGPGPDRVQSKIGSDRQTAQAWIYRSPDEAQRNPGFSYPDCPAAVPSGLVPLHPVGTRFHGVVIPLEPELLLAEHVRLEALPGLELEVVERT